MAPRTKAKKPAKSSGNDQVDEKATVAKVTRSKKAESHANAADVNGKSDDMKTRKATKKGAKNDAAAGSEPANSVNADEGAPVASKAKRGKKVKSEDTNGDDGVHQVGSLNVVNGKSASKAPKPAKNEDVVSDEPQEKMAKGTREKKPAPAQTTKAKSKSSKKTEESGKLNGQQKESLVDENGPHKSIEAKTNGTSDSKSGKKTAGAKKLVDKSKASKTFLEDDKATTTNIPEEAPKTSKSKRARAATVLVETAAIKEHLAELPIKKKREAKPIAVPNPEKPAVVKKSRATKKDTAKVVEVKTVDKAIKQRKRASPVPVEPINKEEEEEPVPAKKVKKAPAKKKASEKEKAVVNEKPKKNETSSDFKEINFGIDKEFKLKICSWNVAGLRALVNKGGLDYFEYEKPDIICLQEIKCVADEVPDEVKLAGFHPYYNAVAGGRNGVAILSKVMPINVEYGFNGKDQDGRILTAEYEKFYLICSYVQNAGRKLVTLSDRLQFNEKFEELVVKLDKKKPVIICGDLNVAHNEIDLTNPKTNKNNAGFTQQERDGMTKLLKLGFVDTFRHLYPEKKGAYSFWSYMGSNRAKNVGWRLDYFITSERLVPKIVENTMRSTVMGSDHCPIVMFANL